MTNAGKRVFRTNRNKMVAGVASGFAEYFEVDPVLVRIIFIILTLINGIGLLIYLILWLIVPLDEEKVYNTATINSSDNKADTVNAENLPKDKYDGNDKPTRTNFRFFAGLILILIGAAFLLENIFPFLDFVDFFPVLLIVIGVSILLKSGKN